MPAAMQDRETLIETAKALWIQGVSFPRISQQIGVNLGTIKGWCQRQKWLQIKTKIQANVDSAVVQVVKSSLEAKSAETREDLAHVVNTQAKALKTAKVTSRTLGNTPFGQGQAAIAKSIAETADKVFGWSANEHGDVNLSMFFNLPADAANVEKSEPIDI